VATAYFAHSAELVARAAEVLGRVDDQKHYAALAARIRDAFANEYVSPAGRLLSDATTAYALALEFALLPTAAQRQHAAERLIALIRESDYRISTGFVGTPLICDALSHTGNEPAAFRLLLQRENPSWLYPVTMGATTIWERWDSMLPDGSINPGEMTSFNHYALGAVADWIHRTIGGLAPAAPGYRAIEVRPRPGGGITRAAARHRTPYGIAECAWAIEAGTFQITVVVPPNTTAHVTLPGANSAPLEVGAGTHHWSYSYQEPEARPPLTIDSSVGELVDDAEAWAVVRGTLARLASNAPFIDQLTHGQSGSPLREVLATLWNADEVGAAIETGLAALGR
jgi:alpha-L-rhamnosidase